MFKNLFVPVDGSALSERAMQSSIALAKQLGAAITGFTMTTKDSLIRPFVSRYFESIERVWTELSHEISQQIIGGLFPQIVDRDVLEASEEFLVHLVEGKVVDVERVPERILTLLDMDPDQVTGWKSLDM